MVGQAMVLLMTVKAIDQMFGGVTGRFVVPLVTVGLLVLAGWYRFVYDLKYCEKHRQVPRIYRIQTW